MKTPVIVLVLLVSVTRHAALQDEHGEVEVKTLTENEKYCQNYVCMELRELKEAMAELKVQLQQNKQQTEQLKTEND
ncbi:cerebellin-2-like, partial [Clarias magur]